MELHYLSPKPSRKGYQNNIIWGIFIISIIFIGYWMLSASENYSTPTLVGKWKSQETGHTITFTEEGEVLKEGKTLLGTYHILSPNQLEYQIDDKTFVMIYQIEGRELSWGETTSSLEVFTRK
ncbi:hypothetical protein CS063_09015 [Sporanaerobium hydrogeniformans]|uniref:Uncharacterized protein n=1 Tax=Sporanaerobium hydrogeniformans TaxID=3072179 RepID=A0AC61DCF2_9FIRM|nr:hypothetical protein [Sporanaerobium hydrogeniformans]PHV70662.1 hypothetical protein CS063_09015 [Sporanaerobium hydrogeniformans]